MTGLYHLTTQNIEAAGARTIITSSSDEKVQYLKAQYDAYYIINYKTTPAWATEAQKIIDGQGVNFILEGGSGTIKQSLDAIAFRGVVWF